MESAPPAQADPSAQRLVKLVLLVHVLLFAAKMSLTEVVGFGDSEALYAVYALFPRASYLDHPGLIGWIGSALAGPHGAPTPWAAHTLSTIVSAAVPFLGGLAARAAGAPTRGVWAAVLVLSLSPELAVGLYGFTPDLPLAVVWLGALGLACHALRSAPGSTAALASTLGAGLCTGLGCMAKASAVTLAAALAVTWCTRRARAHLRTLAPYAGMAVAMVTASPMLLRESRLGWPMLEHRLVHTPIELSGTLRGVGALTVGQLLYVTPVLLAAAVVVAVDLARRHRDDAVTTLLFVSSLVPFAVLGTLMALSATAEPHWLAPAYLPLVIHFARRMDGTPLVGHAMRVASMATGGVAIAAVFLLVRFPVLPALLGKRYDPRWDLSNDLYVWSPAVELVHRVVESAEADGIAGPAIVGPHWVVCAQLQAAFGTTMRVGCATPGGDDFDTFWPRPEWKQARTVIFVTDDRFPADLSVAFPEHAVHSMSRVGVRRGGVVVRTIRVVRLQRSGAAHCTSSPNLVCERF